MKFHRPLTGSERNIRRFTVLPTYVNGIVYWLEWVNIHQSYNTRHFGWNNDWVD